MHRLTVVMAIAALTLLALLSACGPDNDDPSTPTPGETGDGEPTAVTGTSTAGDVTPTATLADLNGTDWELTAIDNQIIDAPATVTLSFAGGFASGNAGCNDYRGSYSAAADGKLSITEIERTEMACQEPAGIMEFEDDYLERLAAVAGYGMTEPGLELRNAEGEPTLAFQPATAAAPQSTPTSTVDPTPTAAQPTPTTPAAAWGNWEIYVMSADGSDQHRPSPSLDIDSSPVWMPDGRLSFLSDRGGKRAIYATNPDGSGLELLPIDAGHFTGSFDWSPDGSRLVYASSKDGYAQIYAINADGTNEQRLTNFSEDIYDPVWSPSGDQIAFTRYVDSGPGHILIMNADGSDLRQGTDSGTENLTPAWSPDGSLIAFARHTDFGPLNIYVMNPDGSNVRQITEGEHEDIDPAWSPDGSRIAFVRDRDIWVTNADGSGLLQITNVPRSDDSPDWSPDGSQIAFVSDRDGGQPVECSFEGVNDYAAIESLEQLAWMSERIVAGTVAEQLEPAFRPNNDPFSQTLLIYTDSIIDVEIGIRGEPADTIRIREEGGTIGDCHQEWEGEPELQPGQRVLVFLFADELNSSLPPAWMIIGGSQGYWPVDEQGRVSNELYPDHDGDSVDEVADAIRQILSQPPPDIPDLVPLEEAPITEGE